MNDLPLVTVVIPNHNYGHWIADAIKSVVSEAYPAELKQMVIVDDNSTDSSWEVVTNLFSDILKSDNDNVIGYINNCKMALTRNTTGTAGPSATRNVGIKAAWETTDLYGFLDADDIYLQGKISRSVSKFCEDKLRIGFIYSDYDTVNTATGLKISEYKEPFSRNRLVKECIVHSACIVSKTALERCGLYDETLRTCEDYDMWLRISEQFVGIHIPETLMEVRVGSYNSTNSVDKSIWQNCYQKVMQKAQLRMRQ